MRSISDADRARFMRYVRIDEATSAWLWTGGLTGAGYGAFWLQGRTLCAHRASWWIHRGPIPPGMFVCHRHEDLGRHNVNPDHLFLGTATDNMRDAAAKGRMPAGERNHQAVLRSEQVAEILASEETGAVIGARLGVSQAKISKIRRGEAWRHLEGAPAPCAVHSLRNKSGYRGVYRHQDRWSAAITVTDANGKRTIWLGGFDDPAAAARAFDEAARRHRGPNAKLNFPVPDRNLATSQ
jgi:hypothetical protein